MTSRHILNEGGVIGSEVGTIDTDSPDFRILQAQIINASKKQTQEQIRENELLALRFRMEEYLKQQKPERIIKTGGFLKELLTIFGIKNKRFADYIGWSESNLSALINGRRKLNHDLAIKFGYIFKINPSVWINIQNQNDLWETERADFQKYQNYNLNDLIGA